MTPVSILGSSTPGTVDVNDPSSVNLGIVIQSDVDCQVVGLRFYKSTANIGTHIGALWLVAGSVKLAEKTYSGETASGWQEVMLDTPVNMAANTPHMVSYLAPSGHYSRTSDGLVSAVTNGHLTALAAGSVSGGNGKYAYNAGLVIPNNNGFDALYFVDVLVEIPASGLSIPVAMNQYRQRWN